MQTISYQRIYSSCEYLSSLGPINYRALFGGYSLSVGDTIFAMVSEGHLYLRACEQSAAYCLEHKTPLLSFVKRGRHVLLNYYRVDESLWHDRDRLLTLSNWSLAAARTEKMHRTRISRLKDLPNLSFQLETLMCEAGIPDCITLKKLGAKACWTRMRNVNAQLSVKVLYALEGAIAGVHEAALPALVRQELKEWYYEFENEAKSHQQVT